jgi:hypothetical protein
MIGNALVVYFQIMEEFMVFLCEVQIQSLIDVGLIDFYFIVCFHSPWPWMGLQTFLATKTLAKWNRFFSPQPPWIFDMASFLHETRAIPLFSLSLDQMKR